MSASACAQECESKQRVDRERVEAVVVLPRLVEAGAGADVEAEDPARVKDVALVVRRDPEVDLRVAAPEDRHLPRHEVVHARNRCPMNIPPARSAAGR